MDNSYIDNTIEVIIKAFENKNMENTEQYKKIKEIQVRREGRKHEK